MSKTIEELERERKAWSTPDFNPNMEDTFKPYSFIKSAGTGISARTQGQLNQLNKQMQPPPLRQDIIQQMSPQTMQPTQGMLQLPNGQFVTPEQYQQLLIKLQQR